MAKGHLGAWEAVVDNVKPHFRGSHQLKVGYGGSIYPIPPTDPEGQQKRRDWELKHGKSADSQIIDPQVLWQRQGPLDVTREPRDTREEVQRQLLLEQRLRHEARLRDEKHLREQRQRRP